VDHQDFSASPARLSRKSERLLLLYSLLAAISQSLGRGDWRRLLRLCSCSAHPAQSRFPVTTTAMPMGKFPRPARRRKRPAKVLLVAPPPATWKSFHRWPAILWTPFLLVGPRPGPSCAHPRRFRSLADGFSTPYRIAMALGTVHLWFSQLAPGLPPRAPICRRGAGPPSPTLAIWWPARSPFTCISILLVSRTFLFRCGSFPLYWLERVPRDRSRNG